MKEHEPRRSETMFDGQVIEFTSEAIPVIDESTLPPRFGGPSAEVLAERRAMALEFLRSIGQPLPDDPMDSVS